MKLGHKPRKVGPGMCMAPRPCPEWATIALFHADRHQEILCDLHWDAQRRALQTVFGERWETTVEVRELNSAPREERPERRKRSLVA